MLPKKNVSASSKVELIAAMVGAARGDCKKEWYYNSGAIFHMPHTRAGTTTYK